MDDDLTPNPVARGASVPATCRPFVASELRVGSPDVKRAGISLSRSSSVANGALERRDRSSLAGSKGVGSNSSIFSLVDDPRILARVGLFYPGEALEKPPHSRFVRGPDIRSLNYDQRSAMSCCFGYCFCWASALPVVRDALRDNDGIARDGAPCRSHSDGIAAGRARPARPFLPDGNDRCSNAPEDQPIGNTSRSP